VNVDEFLNIRRAEPLYHMENLTKDPSSVAAQAGEQVKTFLAQDNLTETEKALAFGGILKALADTALYHPDLRVSVEWLDEHNLPQPVVTTPTEAIRLSAARNVQQINSRITRQR
jgi:hypothetical protein